MNNHQPGWKNPNWKYIPARYTDIFETFKKLGWKAPSESRVKSSPSSVNN
jgi:hypothetical protein